MNITPTIHYEETFPRRIVSHSKYDGRTGFWGDVTAVDSSTNSCTVINDQGLEIEGIQVASKEWVVKEDNKDYASCERDLPPIGARVYVITPDGNIANALIICSGYPILENNVQTLWAKADPTTEEGQKTIQKLNRIGERISQGGWHRTESYDTGNYKIESADGQISLEVNPVQVEDDQHEVVEAKKIKLSAWGCEIEFSPVEDQEQGIEKKIAVTLLGNVIEFTESGFSITDPNGNSYATDENGLVLEDANGNTMTMDNSGIDFNGYLTVAKRESE